MIQHTPVLIKEVLHYLNPKPGGTYLDATFGQGGYTKAILEKDVGKVFAIDQDKEILSVVKKFQDDYAERFSFFLTNFSKMKDVIPEKLNGIVFDFGTSANQLLSETRGFSFSHDSFLDMRMDTSEGPTAADILRIYSEVELAEIIYRLGGDRKSRKIAKAITEERKKSSITTTKQLESVIHNICGSTSGRLNSATKTFQALRIHVNNEIEHIKIALRKAVQIINHGGVIVTVSFHELEDREVKKYFKSLSQTSEILTKKVVIASKKEVGINPRARSAKLRAIKINHVML